MSRLKNYRTGTFLRIPLEDGSFGYGRALSKVYIAFYEHWTQEPSTDLDAIAVRPVLFAQAVRVFRDSGWVTLGVRPLAGEVARPMLRYWQDIADYRNCRIFDTAGMKRQATPEECIGIEESAVWDAPNIAERLLDTFMGRPNGEEIRSRVRLAPYPDTAETP